MPIAIHLKSYLLLIFLAIHGTAIGSIKDETTFIFLSWDTNPTKEMTIQLLSSNQTEPSFQYKEKDSKSWISKEWESMNFSNSQIITHLHQHLLKGLDPDSTYELKLSDSGKVYQFKTAPQKLSKDIKFVIGGDIGVKPVVKPLLREAAALDPLFAVIGGDIAYGDGRKAERWEQFLTYWCNNMIAKDNRLIPMSVCIGNHEVPGGFNRSYKRARFFSKLYRFAYPKLTYKSLNIGDDLSFIFLDTGHVLPIEGAQTDWLDKTLRDVDDRAHIFPVYHVPAYPGYRDYLEHADKDTRGGYLQRKHWIPLFDKHQIKLVFENDDHLYKRTKPLKANKISPSNGTVYVGDGAWGKGRSLPKNVDRFYLEKHEAKTHFMLMTVSRHGWSCESIDEKGEVFDNFSRK